MYQDSERLLTQTIKGCWIWFVVSWFLVNLIFNFVNQILHNAMISLFNMLEMRGRLVWSKFYAILNVFTLKYNIIIEGRKKL